MKECAGMDAKSRTEIIAKIRPDTKQDDNWFPEYAQGWTDAVTEIERRLSGTVKKTEPWRPLSAAGHYTRTGRKGCH